jgi:transposase
MLSPEDYQEVLRRYKSKNLNGHERQRSHALRLVTKGYTYRQIADILCVDEEPISRWVRWYQERGLDGVTKHPPWGGEHGQRWLGETELAPLSQVLEHEAMPGTRVGSGWTMRAIRVVREERLEVRYSRRGGRKLRRGLHGSSQRGRQLYLKRRAAEQARFDWEPSNPLVELAARAIAVTPLAGDHSKVYREGTGARRWNPVGQQPRMADGARSKAADNISGAVHVGTGEEVAPFVLDWQDSDATIGWLEQVLAAGPRGELVLGLDQAPPHTSEEVEEWLAAQRRLRVLHFPAYTPEENPQEGTWKTLKEAVSHHCWHETKAALSQAIDQFYQRARPHAVHFLEKFGSLWREGKIHPLPLAA